MQAQRNDPNGTLRAFLAQHEVDREGKCSCGWNIANYDLTRYEWEQDDGPVRNRAWVEHVRKVWGRSHGLGKIQQVTVTDPNGDPVTFDMEPGYDKLSEAPEGLGRSYHGEYRYADYEPPRRDPQDVSRRMTCEEAGCRDAFCSGGHRSFTLSFPDVCSRCREPFAEGEETVAVGMQMPPGALEHGTVVATSARYHVRCEPSQEELRHRAAELWPTP